jgi:tryptophan synthase beta chain
VISAEIKKQLRKKTGSGKPDRLIGCVGGGSNAAGTFYHYLKHPEVELVGVEAAGHGISSGETAATLAVGSPGVLHGARSVVMQNSDGQIEEPYSISAGLDYPGIGPLHAHLFHTGRAKYLNVTDDEAMQAALLLTRSEGIIPALESAHALAALEKISLRPEETTVVCVSGRGDKDMASYLDYFGY